MRLQFLNSIGLVEAIVLAAILGAMFGYALTVQFKLQKEARYSAASSAPLIVRLAVAICSLVILFVAAVSSKSVGSLRYEYFMMIAACVAGLVMLIRRTKTK